MNAAITILETQEDTLLNNAEVASGEGDIDREADLLAQVHDIQQAIAALKTLQQLVPIFSQ